MFFKISLHAPHTTLCMCYKSLKILLLMLVLLLAMTHCFAFDICIYIPRILSIVQAFHYISSLPLLFDNRVG